MINRLTLNERKRIVIKIGTSSITHPETGHISLSKLERFVRQIADIINSGKEVVVVTSGAIAVGVSELKLDKKPDILGDVQAVSAVGQASLIRFYQKFFREYNMTIGQILITKDVIDHDQRRLNAVHTFNSLIKMKTIPVVNENDTVSTEEIEFGDNDRLSAIVAELVEADLLILLSDIDGLHDKNPKEHKDTKIIHQVDGIDEAIYNMAGESSSKVGTGGMITKLKAGEIANRAGIDMIIANSEAPQVLERIFSGELIGTLFMASK